MRIERRFEEQSFTLEVFDIQDDDRTLVAIVPLVAGWLQLNLEIKTTPSAKEQQVFLEAAQGLTDGLRRARSIEAWFFLHKAPGLLLRYRTSKNVDAAITQIVEEIPGWNWSWIGAVWFDSYFQQKELLSGYYESETTALLNLSSDCYIESFLAGRHSNVDEWADFTVSFLNHFLRDAWLAWEAIGRFLRLRSVLYRSPATTSSMGVLFSPVELRKRLPKSLPACARGFEASITFLQCLNYIFNQWAVDVPAQQAILSRARAISEPHIRTL